MSDKPVDTFGQIRADFFVGRITAEQADSRRLRVLLRTPILRLLLCYLGAHVWRTEHAWVHTNGNGEKHFVSWAQNCQRCPLVRQKMKELR